MLLSNIIFLNHTYRLVGTDIMYTRQANKMNYTFPAISPYTLSSTIELSLKFNLTDCHDQCISSDLSTAETNRK